MNVPASFGASACALRTGSIARAVANCSIGQPLALGALQREVGTGGIVNAQGDTAAVAEIELGHVAVQMLLPAMLVDAFHAALEDAVEALDRVGVSGTSDIFADAVANDFMAREELAHGHILPGLIRHDASASGDMLDDDGEQIGSLGAVHMEAAGTATALHQRQDRVLVSGSACLRHSGLAADERLVNLDDGASPTKRATEQAGFARGHRHANAMRQEPRGFEAAAEGAVKLAGADALLAAAHQVNGLKPDAQGNVAALEHGPHADGERLAAGVALIEAGAGRLATHLPDALSALAVMANRTTRPELRLDVGEGGFFVVEMVGGKGGLHGVGISLTPNLSQRAGYVKCNIAFANAEGCLAFLCNRVAARGLYIGGTTHQVVTMAVRTPEDLARAYQKEWVTGNAAAEPDAAALEGFLSMYRQAQELFV